MLLDHPGHIGPCKIESFTELLRHIAALDLEILELARSRLKTDNEIFHLNGISRGPDLLNKRVKSSPLAFTDDPDVVRLHILHKAREFQITRGSFDHVPVPDPLHLAAGNDLHSCSHFLAYR